MSNLLNLIQKELKHKTGAHDINHLIRVKNIAESIGKEEGANLKILEAMSLLHDIVRPENSEDRYHTIHSATKAQEILKRVGFSNNEIETVVQGIRSHSIHSDFTKEPASLEARILFDADKIEAVGYIGVSRWFMTMASKNVSLKEAALIYIETVRKFKKTKGKLYTKLGNKLINSKVSFSVNFMKKLLKQLEKD